MAIFRFFPIPVLFLVLCCSAISAADPISIAMILWRGETEAEKGFKQGLHERGYQAEFAVFDAGQEMKQLGRILKDISQRKNSFDYVYTFGTTVSTRTYHILRGSPPQLFNIVTDPVKAGIVNNMDLPGENISGASDAIPVSIPIDYLNRIKKFSTLGLFFNPREKNSMIIRDELKDLARQRSFNIIDFRTPPVDGVLQGYLRQLRGDPSLVDVVFLPPDSYLTSKSKLIAAELSEAGIITIGTGRECIENGVLFGVSVDYFQLGNKVAEIVDLHRKGRPLGEIPIATATEHSLIINTETRDRLRIVFPSTFMEKASLVP